VDVNSAELGADEEREALVDYLREVGVILFVGIVTRIMEPGSKFDTMVVLEGRQNLGKSTLLRVIALKDEWFSDSLPHDLSSKDARLHLRGKLIVEMPEISQVNRSTIETIKAYLSAQSDRLRPPWGRHEITHQRQCVFVGTTNERNYLKDHTGNRRFLPVSCDRIDLALARNIREQLYAEALFEYQKGTRPVLSAALEAVAERQQRERMIDDVWAKPVRGYIRELRSAAARAGKAEVVVAIGDVLSEALRMERGHQDRAAETRVGSILARLGAEKKRRRIDGRPSWVSVLPVSPEEGEAPRHETPPDEDGRLL
jgi:putative DNA primase/helicase